ncbi:ABC transporter transmembrane domain-containing protein [Gallaecimonas sp. GXIMD4217]|uniref:ABC transporter ATP-binding protein n=1 Tax=Gallaecimonas sp. GXIMD4217 TaxID=3131927 RepID=UPI00311ACE55
MSRNAKQASAHRRRLELVAPFRLRLLGGLLVMLATIVIQLSYPQALSHFIDNVDRVQDPQWFSLFAVAMAALLLVQAGATALRYYLFESTGLMLVNRVRNQVHRALLSQPIAFYDRHNVGELTNRLSADVEVLHDTLTMGLAISLRSLLVCVGGVALLLLTSPLLSIALLLFIPAILYLGKRVGEGIRLRAEQIQDRHADAGKVAHENFANIRLVHAFNRQHKAQQHYRAKTAAVLADALAKTRYLAGFQGFSTFLVYLALLFTLWLGGRLIAQDALTMGELTSFVLYAGMVAASAGAISGFWSDWMQAIGATERIFAIVDGAPAPPPSSEGPYLQGELQFEAVTFAYPERPGRNALTDFNLHIGKGEKVALIGPSGAGKSTIASLILGFYQPTDGRLRFDGIDARLLDSVRLRQQIAIVEQEPSLFSSSIFENIAYGARDEDVSPQAVFDAARLANAHDFITAFPNGYDTLVGDRGVQLSGGQKQRIAIARAILRNPRILILDEATSALDSAGETLVQGALDNLMQGRTTLMIAHRYSTIAKADRVIVLDRGRLVQQGRHDELAAQDGGLYRRLVSRHAPEARSA